MLELARSKLELAHSRRVLELVRSKQVPVLARSKLELVRSKRELVRSMLVLVRSKRSHGVRNVRTNQLRWLVQKQRSGALQVLKPKSIALNLPPKGETGKLGRV